MALALQPATIEGWATMAAAVLALAMTTGGVIFKVLSLHHRVRVEPMFSKLNVTLTDNAKETANNTAALQRNEVANLKAQEENRAAFLRHDKWQHDQDMQLQEHKLEIGHIKQTLNLLPRHQ